MLTRSQVRKQNNTPVTEKKDTVYNLRNRIIFTHIEADNIYHRREKEVVYFLRSRTVTK